MASSIKQYGLVFLLFAVISAIFVFGSGKVLDPDQFYHIGHASIYKERGIFSADFPWAHFSVWKIYQADIWYGFHILLIPFTFLADLIFGSWLAAVIFAAIFMAVFYFVLKRHGIRWPLFWTLITYFGTTDFLFRLNMPRPQTVTLTLLVLLFSFLIKPVSEKWKKQILLIFLISATAAWVHLSLFWSVLAIIFIVGAIKLIAEKKVSVDEMVAVMSGLIVGWLVRPNPLGAAKIVWVQLFQLLAEKQKGVQLLFGSEIQPLDWSAVKFQLIPLLILWLGMIIVLWKIKKTDGVFIWSSLALSVIFFALAFIVGRRATDFYQLFAVLFASQVFTIASKTIDFKLARWKNFIIFSVMALLLFMIVRHSYVFSLYAHADNVLAPDHLREASLWLKENSAEGDIVFHTSWDSFGPLFYWNQKNYYINGADPIFEYAFSKELYWKNHLMAISGKDYVCGSPQCSEENGENLYDVLTKDFRARYVILELSRNAGLAGNLEKDSRFKKVFDNEKEVIFEIN